MSRERALSRAIAFNFKIYHRGTETQRLRRDKRGLSGYMPFSVIPLCLCASVVGVRVSSPAHLPSKMTNATMVRHSPSRFREPLMQGNQGINIEALLAHVPLFNGLEKDEIARIARGTREVNAARGDILFHKGDTSSGFHLVVYGQIKLAFTSAQGGEKVVDILGQGQSFGEAVMFMEKPYMVYAQALNDSLLLHISKTVILEELEKDPKLGRKMIAGLSIRLHHLITDVESYSLHSGRQRIIGYLLRENPDSNESAITITLPTNKGVIASRLNLTQEHFSRILHELSEKGLIVVAGRKIKIPDVEKLRQYDL